VCFSHGVILANAMVFVERWFGELDN
jgi:hypothetical protein